MGKEEKSTQEVLHEEAGEKVPETGKYEEMYDKSVQGGKVQEATATIWKPEDEGERLVGKVVKISLFDQGTFDAEVNMYLLDTDHGLVSTVLGSATDKQLDKWELEGKLVCITYHGKTMLKDGKQVNNYQVQVF